MNKQIILLLAVFALAIAGGYNRGNKVVLDRTKQNVLNFACGGTDETGSAKVISTDYQYTFKGHPTWLKANGATLTGNAPAGVKGNWQVTASYTDSTGKKSGSTNFYLCFADGASAVPAATKASVYYVNGRYNGNDFQTADAGSYVVLLPFLTGGAVKGSGSVKVLGGANCAYFQTALTAAQKKKLDLQTQLDASNKQYADLDAKIKALKAQKAQLQGQVGAGTDALDAQIAQLTATIAQLQTQIVAEKKDADAAAEVYTQAQAFAASAATAKQTVVDKQAQYEANKAKIDAAQAAYNTAAAAATSAQDGVAAAQSNYDQANSAATAAGNTLSAADAKVADLQAQLNQALKDQAAAKDAADAAAAAVPATKGQLDDANTKLTAAQSDAATAKKAYDDASAGFVVLDFAAELAKADQDIATANSQQDAAKTASDNAQAKYAADKKTYDDDNTQLAALQAKRDDALKAAGGVKAQLAKVNQDICTAEASYNVLTLAIASTKTKISQADLAITKWTLQLKACQNQVAQGPIVGDATCGGSTGTAGTGTITYVGQDYVVCGGIKIYLGSCSSKVYKSGAKKFNVNDNADFEIVQTSGGKAWAKKVACK